MVRHDLLGKRILVTGGASGLGLAAARTFGELGAKVVVADLNADAVKEAARSVGAVAAVAGDVSIEQDCDDIVQRAVAALGGLDGLLNSAGISDEVASALEVDMLAWQRGFDVNVRGTFMVCRAAGRIMLPTGSGAIVNISSVNGISGIPRRHSYAPAKAAVAMLTRTLACEWGGSGVRVNAVAPGYINTAMIERLKAEGKLDVRRIEDRTPMARLGQPEDVAHAAAFLLSEAAAYINGVVLPVDGGWTAYGGAGPVATA